MLHCASPSPSAYVPAEHGVGVTLPRMQKLPRVQVEHSVLFDRLVEAVKVPSEHRSGDGDAGSQ